MGVTGHFVQVADDAPAPAEIKNVTISVIIPTYRRPDMLSRCLEHVFAQERKPDEIIVCVREGDAATQEVLTSLPCRAVKAAFTADFGVVAAMNAGIALSQGDIVALIDDDAYPRVDWLQRIIATFAARESTLGVGGLDLQPSNDQCALIKRLPVGVITWYGRIYGNHHSGTGVARRVQVLKGCNCAYRGEFLRRTGIDRRLRGGGAQVGWEISLAFDAMKAGGALIYDPRIIVDHMIAPRLDSDEIHRGKYNESAAYDIAWNHFSILRRKAPAGIRYRVMLFELFVGTIATPGLLRIFDGRIGQVRERLRRLRITFRAFHGSRFTEKSTVV